MTRGLRIGMVACLFAAMSAPSIGRADEPAAGVLVRRFEIEGAHAVPQAALQAALAPLLNTVASRDDLARAARALERKYQAEYRLLARVSLPPQDVTDGVVRLRVVEARMGAVVLQGPPASAITIDLAGAVIEAAQPRGALLNIDAVSEATLRLNEWPGLNAASSLLPGGAPGQTDVALTLQDRRPWDALLRLDNEGARATGTARLSVDGTSVLPGGHGQTLAASAMLTEGSRMLRLTASTPLNAHGLRSSVYGSALEYRLTAPEFDALDIKGPSSTVGASLNWALRRSAGATSDVSAQIERRSFNNNALGSTLSKYRIDAVTVRWAGAQSEVDGRTSAEVSLGLGQVDLSGSPNQTADALTARTAGGYGVLRATLGRLQALSATQGWLLRLSGQFSNQNLDVSERLPIAGPAGVRAYPASEATGSRGLLASTELQQGLAALGRQDTTVAVFAEAGVADALVNTDFAGAPQKNRLRLAGAGASVEWRPAGTSAALRLATARPVGSHPNPTASGTHQDGSRIGTRWWASAQWGL